MAIVAFAACGWGDDGRARLRPVPKDDQNLQTGPAIGARIPAFEAADQNGNRQTFESLKGPKGLVLLFVRSADWWPFCKTQLVELGRKQEEFRRQGLHVAAVSYDSQELLRVFAARKGLKYPLLADLDSRIIRNFGILNDNFPPGHALHGVPFPGTYIIDERGIVQAKFFEEDHRERFTAGSVLVRQFQTSGGIEKTTVATPHLKLSFSAADADLSPGGRTTLVLEVELAPGMHVYAPGVEGGYIPIDWKMPESKAWLAHPALYPPAKSVHLEAIQETALVYAGRFRVMRDLTIGQGREIASLVGPDRKLVVDGTFRYQACDDRQCFPPRSVPLNWTFRIEELDTQRAPVELRRRWSGNRYRVMMAPIAWIRVINEAEAEPKLRKAYAQVEAARGRVANILKIHSLHPEVMTAHLRLYRELMFGPSELTRAERELIAVAVSVANACHYWIRYHGEALRTLTKDDELVAALERGTAPAELSDRQRALVDYAVKLTRTPQTMADTDVEALRNAGLSDAGIHDAAAVTAYFNFVNRTASGLGVSLEEETSREA